MEEAAAGFRTTGIFLFNEESTPAAKQKFVSANQEGASTTLSSFKIGKPSVLNFFAVSVEIVAPIPRKDFVNILK